MKKIYRHNLSYKILSVVLGIIVWIILNNYIDPTTTKTYNGISIEIKNEEILTKEGKVYYYNNSDGTATVVLKGKRSELEKIDKEKISVIGDFKNIIHENLVPLEGKISEGGVTDISIKPINLELNIEDSISKTMEISSIIEGEAIDGYYIEKTLITPKQITFSGPKSIVSEVGKVVVKVDASTIKESTNKTYKIEFYDKNDKKVDSSLLTTNIGDNQVSVDITLSKTKTINIKAYYNGYVKDGYIVNSIETDPKTIEVIGDSKELENIESINIEGTELDITGLDKTVEKTVDINKYLPKGITLKNEKDASVIVKVTINPHGSRTIDYPISGIKLDNLEEGLSVNFSGEESTVTLIINGNDDIISKLNEEDISVVLDCGKLKENDEFSKNLKIVLPDGVNLKEECKVEGYIKRK